MNHYTEWATVPLIGGGGFNAPSGVNYFTPDWYFSGEEARRRLALDKTPDVVINLLIYPRKDRLKPMYPYAGSVKAANGQPGGGREYKTDKAIPFWSRFPVILPLF
jgi:hypothetical protein